MTQSATRERLTCCPITPPGVGAIAVVALCGAESWCIVRDCVSGPRGALPTLCEAGRLYFGVFSDAGETIDDVILAPQFDSDQRLIGVDISSHGGIRVVERILMSLTAHGAQLVSPDIESPDADWPARIEAQALQHMTRMTTRRSALFLLAQSKLLPLAYARILQLAEERELDAARDELQAIVERSRTARHLVSPAEISFVGPPNAGKSSLINSLSGRDHIVVTDLAGTTRDWVTVPGAIMGGEVTLIDTAGLHNASDDLENIAIARGQARTDSTHLRIHVFDGTTAPPSREQLVVLSSGGHNVVVCNKADLTLAAGWGTLLEDQSQGVHLVSATTGDGLDKLRTVIGTRLNLDRIEDNLPTEFDSNRLEHLCELLDGQADSGTSLAGTIRQVLAPR